MVTIYFKTEDMAFIRFYDATESDRQQLTELLQETDHYWDFIDGPLSDDTIHPDVEMISVFISSTVNRQAMEKMPRLKLIACRSTGFNNIDMSAARDLGITVTNAPSYGDHTVAEYTFLLLLSVMRRLVPTFRAVKDGLVDSRQLTGRDIAGKTLGIVGAGRIGRAVAEVAHGFGMKVQVYDPLLEDHDDRLRSVSLPDLLASSDAVSLHCPYTGSNKHLIGKEEFARMKTGSVLINTARGELVDTKELIHALESGRLAGAGLDVFEGEKLVHADEEALLLRNSKGLSDGTLEQSLELSILRKMPNVIVTPHNAYNTIEAIGRINEVTTESLTRYWYGETPFAVSPVPPEPGKLVLIRHGESEWNALGKWTGTRDVHLTEKGFHEATLLGLAVRDIPFDYAYASEQIRAFETLEGILNASQQFDVPYERSSSLNERDYGEYTGRNKWEMQQLLGDTDFNRLRREWDYPVPDGETLKQVFERVQPYYMSEILPKLQDGKNVLVVSHGNAIRALIKYVEDISDEAIAEVEMIFGKVLIYTVDSEGRCSSRNELRIDSPAPPA